MSDWSKASVVFGDPAVLASDILTKARTVWMRLTFPFARFGRGTAVHHSCELLRSSARRISLGDAVYLAPDVWLAVPDLSNPAPAIILDNGCRIGRRCMISARNQVRLEENVLLGPAVLITDHSHEFADPDLPIVEQGLTKGGTVRVERNCWLGYGAAIVCTSGDLVIGRNSVIGANSVVTRSVPPFSVVAGNPARVIRRYDPSAGSWVKVTEWMPSTAQ